MTDDAELLRSYVSKRSETAFAELVDRHLALVFHSAVRQLQGNIALAQDITQEVFCLLAVKAPSLVSHPTLAGWLHVATHRKVSEAIRTEQRRKIREQVAFMNQQISEGDAGAEWERIRPALDGAILKLGTRDRDALLLRFFEGRTFKEVAECMALTEASAQKRVSRALDKMRRVLAGKGITSSASALAAALATQTGLAAPVGLAASVSHLAAGPGGSGLGTLASRPVASLFMGTTKTKIAVVVIAAASGALLIYQSLERSRLQEKLTSVRGENQALAYKLHGNDASMSSTAAAIRAAQSKEAVLLSQTSGQAGSVAASNGRVVHPLLPGIKAIAEATNAGRASPAAMAETLFWAESNGHIDALSQMLELDPEAKTAAAAVFASLSVSQRSQFQTPEDMMAAWLSSSFPKDVAGYQMPDVPAGVDPDRADVPVMVQLDDGRTVVTGFNLQKVGDAWTLVVNAGYVRALAPHVGSLGTP